MVEHCISAFKILQEEKIFKIYVTDSLKAMGEGKRLADRYADIIIPKQEDTRDPVNMKKAWATQRLRVQLLAEDSKKRR